MNRRDDIESVLTERIKEFKAKVKKMNHIEKFNAALDEIIHPLFTHHKRADSAEARRMIPFASNKLHLTQQQMSDYIKDSNGGSPLHAIISSYTQNVHKSDERLARNILVEFLKLVKEGYESNERYERKFFMEILSAKNRQGQDVFQALTEKKYPAQTMTPIVEEAYTLMSQNIGDNHVKNWFHSFLSNAAKENYIFDLYVKGCLLRVDKDSGKTRLEMVFSSPINNKMLDFYLERIDEAADKGWMKNEDYKALLTKPITVNKETHSPLQTAVKYASLENIKLLTSYLEKVLSPAECATAFSSINFDDNFPKKIKDFCKEKLENYRRNIQSMEVEKDEEAPGHEKSLSRSNPSESTGIEDNKKNTMEKPIKKMEVENEKNKEEFMSQSAQKHNKNLPNKNIDSNLHSSISNQEKNKASSHKKIDKAMFETISSAQIGEVQQQAKKHYIITIPTTGPKLGAGYQDLKTMVDMYQDAVGDEDTATIVIGLNRKKGSPEDIEALHRLTEEIKNMTPKKNIEIIYETFTWELPSYDSDVKREIPFGMIRNKILSLAKLERYSKGILVMADADLKINRETLLKIPNSTLHAGSFGSVHKSTKENPLLGDASWLDHIIHKNIGKNAYSSEQFMFAQDKAFEVIKNGIKEMESIGEEYQYPFDLGAGEMLGFLRALKYYEDIECGFVDGGKEGTPINVGLPKGNALKLEGPIDWRNLKKQLYTYPYTSANPQNFAKFLAWQSDVYKRAHIIMKLAHIVHFPNLFENGLTTQERALGWVNAVLDYLEDSESPNSQVLTEKSKDTLHRFKKEFLENLGISKVDILKVCKQWARTNINQAFLILEKRKNEAALQSDISKYKEKRYDPSELLKNIQEEENEQSKKNTANFYLGDKFYSYRNRRSTPTEKRLLEEKQKLKDVQKKLSDNLHKYKNEKPTASDNIPPAQSTSREKPKMGFSAKVDLRRAQLEKKYNAVLDNEDQTQHHNKKPDSEAQTKQQSLETKRIDVLPYQRRNDLAQAKNTTLFTYKINKAFDKDNEKDCDTLQLKLNNVSSEANFFLLYQDKYYTYLAAHEELKGPYDLNGYQKELLKGKIQEVSNGKFLQKLELGENEILFKNSLFEKGNVSLCHDITDVGASHRDIIQTQNKSSFLGANKREHPVRQQSEYSQNQYPPLPRKFVQDKQEIAEEEEHEFVDSRKITKKFKGELQETMGTPKPPENKVNPFQK